MSRFYSYKKPRQAVKRSDVFERMHQMILITMLKDSICKFYFINTDIDSYGEGKKR